MSTQDKTGEILRLLNELIDLVKAGQPKVENHTHHHYPATPTYYYPNQWTYGGSGTSGGSGTFYPTNVPGSTSTWSTNDPSTPPGLENGTDSPSK